MYHNGLDGVNGGEGLLSRSLSEFDPEFQFGSQCIVNATI